jgi:dephospho-CoA kinase
MHRIGLTGGIGSGKSTVARIFQILGVPVFESDATARVLLQSTPIKAKVKAVFGEGIFHPDGNIDRAKLGARVFSNPQALHELNTIIHPAVAEAFQQWCDTQSSPYIIKEAAIVFEHGLEKQLDGVIVIDAPDALRIPRAAKRLEISTDAVQQRIQNQLPAAVLREKAQWIIDNDEEHLLLPQVLQLHQILLQLPC